MRGAGPSRRSRDRPTFFRLKAGNILRLQAFGALADLEFNSLPFVQGFVPVHLNGRKMDENVLTRLALNETIALAGVEPFHCSLFSHCYYLALSYLRFSFRPTHLTERGAGPRLPLARENKQLQALALQVR